MPWHVPCYVVELSYSPPSLTLNPPLSLSLCIHVILRDKGFYSELMTPFEFYLDRRSWLYMDDR